MKAQFIIPIYGANFALLLQSNFFLLLHKMVFIVWFSLISFDGFGLVDDVRQRVGGFSFPFTFMGFFEFGADEKERN